MLTSLATMDPVGEGIENEDGPFEAGLPPAAQDRLWRHPAERGAHQAAANLEARRSYRRIWPSVLVSFVAGCCVVGLTWMLVDNDQQAPIEEVVINEITPGQVVFEGPLSFDDWVNDVSQLNRASVVSLELPESAPNETAQAILLRDDGHLITSADAIAGAEAIAVDFPGGRLPAQVIGSDPVSGVAVLKINAPDLPPPTFGDETNVSVQDRLVALAHSIDDEELAQTIDLVGVEHVATSIGGTSISNLFSLSDDLDGQWAGSAILSEDGGIVAMTVSSSNGGSYAVPIATARHVANQLIDDGTVDHKSWIGVETSAALSDELKEERGVRGGLLLTRVWDETPAARAGLVAGDIITQAGSVNVFSRTDLAEALAALEPGEPIEISYSRAMQSLPITSTVAEGIEPDVETDVFTATIIVGARPA